MTKWHYYLLETGSPYVSQAVLEFKILQPQLPKCRVIGMCQHAQLNFFLIFVKIILLSNRVQIFIHNF
jgi:hypothetical protein